MTRTVLMLAVVILSGAAGEIALTHGMKKVGEPTSFSLRDLLSFLKCAFRSAWLWIGLPLMALSFYALLLLLSWEPVSFVVPASALGYVVGTLGARYILGEEVSVARWAGVLLVCAGVALVAAG
jgi:drug/metabolite transporter (DMT)-like permease